MAFRNESSIFPQGVTLAGLLVTSDGVDIQTYDGVTVQTYKPETDTGWVTLTHSGSSGNMRYRARNGVVFVEANVGHASLANGASLTLLTVANALPAAYRPGQSLYTASVRVNGGTQVGNVGAFTDGTVVVVNQSGVAVTASQFRYSYLQE
jgi:hypothetical protein